MIIRLQSVAFSFSDVSATSASSVRQTTVWWQIWLRAIIVLDDAEFSCDSDKCTTGYRFDSVIVIAQVDVLV